MKDSKLMKIVRTRLGLTQAKMAERLGYKYHKEISNIENEKENMSNQTRAHLHTLLQQIEEKAG